METVLGARLGTRAQLGLRLIGAGLLAAAGAIHLDLYLTGYRSIPTIGWLFLFQLITAFLLAVAVAASGHWLAAAAGAGFALATLGGYLLSVWVGLFGFREVRTSAGIVAGVVEVAAFTVLAALAVTAARQSGVPERLPASLRGAVEGRRAPTAVAGVVSVAALALLGVAVAQASGTGASTGGGPVALKTATVSGTTVLTNSKGFTLYWFAPDTPTTSKCNGSCTAYWPPLKGPATAGSGVKGQLGVITRSNGSKQATYNGHPLYTYIGDKGPGQARGNNLDLNGGVWHEVTVSG